MDTQNTAYSYIRFSTPEQRKGDSLKRQIDLSHQYASEHGLILDDTLMLRDEGVSAFDSSNVDSGALGAFLKKVESKDVQPGSYLLVESLDRLSRANVFDALHLLSSIIRKGITVVTLCDEMEYSIASLSSAIGPQNLMFSIMIMGRAHEESLMKSKRLKSAWQAKRDQSSTKKITRICPAWLTLNKDTNTFDFIENNVSIVVRIFDMASTGHGSYSIMTRLNKEGIPPFGKANGWHKSYIEKILAGRAVLGEFQPHRIDGKKRIPSGDLIDDYFPQIVSNELWNLVYTKRQQRKNKGGRSGIKVSNLFSGMVKCGVCESNLEFENKGTGPKGGEYLICSSSRRSLSCTQKRVRYDRFESTLLACLKELDFKSILNEGTHHLEIKKLKDTLNGYEVSIELDNRRLEGIHDSLLNSDAIPATYVSVTSKLENRLKDLYTLKEKDLKRLDELEDSIRFSVVRQQEINKLLVMMDQLDGHELYDLRKSLQSCICSIVDSIEMKSQGTQGNLSCWVNFKCGGSRVLSEFKGAVTSYSTMDMEREASEPDAWMDD